MKLFAYTSSDWDQATISRRLAAWEKTSIMVPNRLQELQKNYPYPFYSPNIFIRIGLFIFTLIIQLASVGLMLFLFSSIIFDIFPQGSLFFLALAIFVVLEILIDSRKIYSSGIDEALLYSGIAVLISSMSLFNPLPEQHYELGLLLFSFPILAICSIRYADRLLTLLAYICLILIVAYLFIQWQGYGTLLLPFALMLISFLSYRFAIKKCAHFELRFWRQNFVVVEWLSLSIFYLAGNYFVIQKLSQTLLPSYEISLSFTLIFYLFTILTPVLYLFLGIKNKNRTLLNIGLITLALTAITIVYLGAAQHYEIWMLAGGVFLIGFAWYAIQKLKHIWKGFSYQPDLEEQHLLEHSELEAYVVSGTLSSTTSGPENPLYGGGSFGGGGAEGHY
jgi:hypothetical protein